MNKQITPLSEKSVDGEGIEPDYFFYKDVKQALKNFCEELKEKITFHNKIERNERHWIFRELDKAKLKHFGSELTEI